MRGERPNVPIEEVPSSPRPIEGVGTSVAAFVGVMPDGPWGPSFVRSWPEFADRWPSDAALAGAVREYFRNGGSIAWVAPVERLEPDAVRGAIEAMHRDVTLVAVIADPPAPADVVGAAAQALADRRAMLLVEGPWPHARAAIAAMLDDPSAALGAEGADVAVYWPRVRRPRDGGDVQEISPLGPVAGMFARIDATRGVFTMPAGMDAGLEGVTEPATGVTQAEAGELNALGVNVIRAFPGIGTRVWGGRTRSSDVEWKYVPVRRTALYIEESIERGLDWAVFEPNTERLWATVRGSVADFLYGLYRDGAFPAATPDQGFFVRCDRTTMTQDDIDGGRLVCLVGVALLEPAEFVTMRITVRTAEAGA